MLIAFVFDWSLFKTPDFSYIYFAIGSWLLGMYLQLRYAPEQDEGECILRNTKAAPSGSFFDILLS